jgi:hypothetical protein
MHVRQQKRVKGGVFDMELVARKWQKGGAFFNVVLKRVHFLNLGQNLRKKGYILSSQSLKRVPCSPPVTTRKGSYFENHFLTWVSSLRSSDPRAPYSMHVLTSRCVLVGIVLHPCVPVYCATKHAVRAYTCSLAVSSTVVMHI